MNSIESIVNLMSQQINPLKTIQNLIATKGNLLEESEMRELEDYTDKQLRMCEFTLKLAKSIAEKESAKQNTKKMTRQKKEEVLIADNEEAEEEDFDDLLG